MLLTDAQNKIRQLASKDHRFGLSLLSGGMGHQHLSNERPKLLKMQLFAGFAVAMRVRSCLLPQEESEAKGKI
jgi:hypothetical protein